MYTDPQIYSPQDESKRGFISFYFNGKRYRFYNGKPLGLECYPNADKSLKERDRFLKHLLREFTVALAKGWSPEVKVVPRVEVKQIALMELLNQLQEIIQASSFSKTYIRDLTSVTTQFSAYLVKEGRDGILATEVEPSDVERFLQQFSLSGTYYQNKRRNLNVAFSKLVKLGYCPTNPVIETSKRKSKAVLHKAYTPEQLSKLLPFLKVNYPNLYLCALLMYGTLLRPHQEIRLLKRRHFNEDLTQFYLDGHENKSGRIRSLPVPDYVREELFARKVNELEPEHNLFTRTLTSYNAYYFNYMWVRAKPKMLKFGLIESKQTLYSFRHTASINVFKKTGNLKLLQQLFDHSDMNTTLTYLRSLGVIQVDYTVMPELLPY